jgi:hypothetical protein
LATIAGDVTGNQTLKNIGSVTGKLGAIAQTVTPKAAGLAGMLGHSMENYGRYESFSLTRDTYDPSLYQR